MQVSSILKDACTSLAHGLPTEPGMPSQQFKPSVSPMVSITDSGRLGLHSMSLKNGVPHMGAIAATKSDAKQPIQNDIAPPIEQPVAYTRLRSMQPFLPISAISSFRKRPSAVSDSVACQLLLVPLG